MDYVHFNPVKHRYVSVVAHWPQSTFCTGAAANGGAFIDSNGEG